jgi:hypothetical protein
VRTKWKHYGNSNRTLAEQVLHQVYQLLLVLAHLQLPQLLQETSPVCPGTTGLTYTVPLVATATSYNWAVPTGWVITGGAGTNAIMLLQVVQVKMETLL